jgi:hypothetical protein
MPYLTPDNVPNEYLWKFVRIPNTNEIIGALSGQIGALGQAWKWEQSGDLTPEETAEIFIDLIKRYVDWQGSLIGSIVLFSGVNPPDGTLLCNGQVHLRANYPELWYFFTGSLYQLGSDFFVTPFLEPSGEDPQFALFDYAIISGRSITTEVISGIQNFFGDAVPAAISAEPGIVRLGMRFYVTDPAIIVGVRFYKDAANVGLHTGSLWTIEGDLIAEVDFEDETTDGWQEQRFPDPIILEVDTPYVIAYHTDEGNFGRDLDYFDTDTTVGVISVPADNSDALHASYYWYDVSGDPWPENSYFKSNYYVDVMIVPL